jgi:hypothetical protein
VWLLIGAAQTRLGSVNGVAVRRARRGRRRYALARPVGQFGERHRTGRDVAWRSRVSPYLDRRRADLARSTSILLTTYCLLLTAYCSLLTAYCSLLTAHCLLLTAYCPLIPNLDSGFRIQDSSLIRGHRIPHSRTIQSPQQHSFGVIENRVMRSA